MHIYSQFCNKAHVTIIPFYFVLTCLQVNPSDVIILEGILVFHDPRVRELMNMKIFVDTGPFISFNSYFLLCMFHIFVRLILFHLAELVSPLLIIHNAM